MIKTHTPLDGLPLDRRATSRSLRRHRRPGPTCAAGCSWIDDDSPPQQRMDGLRGMLWHATDAWTRRDEPNVVLTHFVDLLADLRCCCAARPARTCDTRVVVWSSHGDSCGSGAGSAGSSGVWKISSAQIICIQVVPLLERVLMTMSPSRNRKLSQRALSSSPRRTAPPRR